MDSIKIVFKRYIREDSLLWAMLRDLLRITSGRLRLSPVRPWRPQWLPRWMRLSNEKDVHPHASKEHAELFLTDNGGGTEIEVLNWLYATVCLLKPKRILETGVWKGVGTLALAAACKANGFGEVHSLEIDVERCKEANKLLRKAGLLKFATVHYSDSLTFLRDTTLTFDFAFFDSDCVVRTEEYKLCRQRRILKGIACFHDTSPTRTLTYSQPGSAEHAEFRKQIYEFSKQAGVSGYFESTLSKGIIVLFLNDK